MKKTLLVLVVIAIACGFIACKKKAAVEEFFILGVQQPMTGENAIAGQSATNAVKLFVDQRNKEGGFL